MAVGIKKGIDEGELGARVKEKRVYPTPLPLSHAVNAGCDLHVFIPSSDPKRRIAESVSVTTRMTESDLSGVAYDADAVALLTRRVLDFLQTR